MNFQNISQMTIEVNNELFENISLVSYNLLCNQEVLNKLFICVDINSKQYEISLRRSFRI